MRTNHYIHEPTSRRDPQARRRQPDPVRVAEGQRPTKPEAEQQPATPRPRTAALPCPVCGDGHLLAHIALPLTLSVHLTREGQVRPAEVLTTKRHLQALAQHDFTPLADQVPLSCSACDYTSTVAQFKEEW